MKISMGKTGKITVMLVFAGVVALYGCLSWAGNPLDEAMDFFARGNRAYAEGKYDEAVSFYKRVMEEQGYSAPLLYNLGNAYYKKKDAGRAILNYERALYLDPGNTDIRRNLELARRNFGLDPRPEPKWNRFFNLLNLNQWAVFASTAFGIFSLLYLLRGVGPAALRKVPIRFLSMGAILCLLVGGAGTAIQYRNATRGVIITDHARLLVSPFDTASVSASPKDGKTVRIARAYRDYLLVGGPDGKTGWIKKNAVEPVVPTEQRT